MDKWSWEKSTIVISQGALSVGMEAWPPSGLLGSTPGSDPAAGRGGQSCKSKGSDGQGILENARCQPGRTVKSWKSSTVLKVPARFGILKVPARVGRRRRLGLNAKSGSERAKAVAASAAGTARAVSATLGSMLSA